MSRVLWLGIYILQIIRLSYQRSDYASDPSELPAVETTDPSKLQAVETTDNRQQPNPNWPQLPNVHQLNVPQTNMIPSPQMQGGFPNNLPGQQPMWPNSGAVNSPGGQPMVTNPLSPAGFPGAQNPMMMGAPGAFNFPGVQNPMIMGAPGAFKFPGVQNPIMMEAPGAFNFPGVQNPMMMGAPGASNFPGVQNPPLMGQNPLALGASLPGGHSQQINPNRHVVSGMPAHFHPVGHLPFPGTMPLMPWQTRPWTKEQLEWWYWWNYWQNFMKKDEGICYLVLEQFLTWTAARDTCRREGNDADLASINSQQEQNFIETLIKDKKCHGWCAFWMGFNDLAREGNWVWSNGDPGSIHITFLFVDSSGCWNISITYKNWQNGEPNNLQKSEGRENCGELVRGWGYKWNDHPDGKINPSVCSKKIHF